jgi:hypothetical protein
MSGAKEYKFSVRTIYKDDEFYGYVKQNPYRNSVYIYIYERGLFKNSLLLALKVTVHERE